MYVSHVDSTQRKSYEYIESKIGREKELSVVQAIFRFNFIAAMFLLVDS
jgi:hypothetical protein